MHLLGCNDFVLGVSGFSTVSGAVENAFFPTMGISIVLKMAFSTAPETVENPKTPKTKNIAT
jgi:hypothetical protein